jgi:hypothetical protein
MTQSAQVAVTSMAGVGDPRAVRSPHRLFARHAEVADIRTTGVISSMLSTMGLPVAASLKAISFPRGDQAGRARRWVD